MPIKAIISGTEKEITRIPVLAHDIETATGTNSVTFNTSSDRVIECDILGNGQQVGTPAPSNIIMPDFCGERTENLFDSDTAYSAYKQSDGTYRGTVNNFYTTHVTPFTTDDIGKTFTFTIVIKETTSTNVRAAAKVNGSDVNGNNLSKAGTTTVTFTVSSVNDYLYLGYGSGGGNQIRLDNIMLNLGSTPLPYEPYGWAEKITCAGQTVPVYLGEVPTVRKVKKFVLTGAEDWTYDAQYTRFTTEKSDFVTLGLRITPFLSNAFVSVDDGRSISSIPDNSIYSGAGDYRNTIYIKCSEFASVDSWKSWLAERYASGDPIIIWYILRNEETGIVNDPLAKIGTYADELHITNEVTIPTIKGTNTLTVDTTLPPSQTTVTYRGMGNVYKDTWEVRDNQDRLLWYREDTLTGTSSISYKGYGIPLKSMSVLGNGNQNGTPSPTNIVPFDRCGDTLNIFDKSIADITPNSGLDMNNERWIYNAVAAARVLRIPCKPSTQYSLSYTLTTIPPEYGTSFIRVAVTKWTDKPTSSSNVNLVTLVNNTYTETGYKTATFTTDSDSKYILIQTNGEYTIFEDMVNSLMLVYGSTALPYEPYAFKIPYTSNGVSSQVDLSQVSTVRRIRKLVLDGNTSMSPYTGGTTGIGFVAPAIGMLGNRILGRSSHFITQSTGVGSNDDGVTFGINNTTLYFTFSEKSVNAYNLSDLASIRQYLAAQYAAGTPVCVWYVLATPTTGIVNEPLAKISDYADELTTVPGITPQTGTNTLTVDTTLSPSSVSITGHIKETV